jgi:hypothetical protein
MEVEWITCTLSYFHHFAWNDNILSQFSIRIQFC